MVKLRKKSSNLVYEGEIVYDSEEKSPMFVYREHSLWIWTDLSDFEPAEKWIEGSAFL